MEWDPSPSSAGRLNKLSQQLRQRGIEVIINRGHSDLNTMGCRPPGLFLPVLLVKSYYLRSLRL